MRTIIAFLFLPLLATLSFGKARKIEISKNTQGKSPIEFSVQIIPDKHLAEHCLVMLELPSEQLELADLWKLYLWVLQDKKTVIGAPLDQDHSKDKTITVHFHGHIDMVGRSLLGIRCGKHAPLNETIYQIHVGSYLPDADQKPTSQESRMPLHTDSNALTFLQRLPELDYPTTIQAACTRLGIDLSCLGIDPSSPAHTQLFDLRSGVTRWHTSQLSPSYSIAFLHNINDKHPGEHWIHKVDIWSFRE